MRKRDYLKHLGFATSAPIAATNTSCNHNKKELGYMQWMAWAEKLTQDGIKQKQCPICKLWLFPEELKAKIRTNE